MPRSSNGVRAALAVLTALAFALKLWGLDYSLPHAIEPDSHLALAVGVLRAEAEKPNRHHNDAQYPLLVARLGQLAPRAVAPPKVGRTLQQHLEAASSLYVLTRTIVALLAALVVPAAFLYARAFVPPRWALLAAGLSGASLLHQFFAQQARPHAVVTTTILLSLVASMRMRRTPTVTWYLVAGTAAALAIGTLQSGMAVLLPGLVAHFAREGPRRARDLWKLLIPVGVILASVPLFHPFLLTSSPDAEFAGLRVSAEGIRFSKHVLPWSEIDGSGARIVLRTIPYFEPALVPLIAAALAAVALARWRGLTLERFATDGDRRVALAFALPYLAMLVLFASTFDRFVLPLVPHFAVLGAWGAWQWSRPTRSSLARRVAIGAAIGALALHAATSVRLAWLRTRPDTLQLAARWLEDNADPRTEAVFLSPTIDLPLPRARGSLERGDRGGPTFSRWASYQARLPAGALDPPLWSVSSLTLRKDLGFAGTESIAADPDGYVRALGPGWYVYDATHVFRHESVQKIGDALARLGSLERRYAPIDSGLAPDFSLFCGDEIHETPYLSAPWVFPRVWQAGALGPVVEIWRVEAP